MFRQWLDWFLKWSTKSLHPNSGSSESGYESTKAANNWAVSSLSPSWKRKQLMIFHHKYDSMERNCSLDSRSHKIGNCVIITWCGGLMITTLDSILIQLNSNPGEGHCVVFFCKTFYLHSGSLHQGVKMGTGTFKVIAYLLRCLTSKQCSSSGLNLDT